MKHSLGTNANIDLEKFMLAPSIISSVFHKAACKEIKVHREKASYADRAWYVHMDLKLNGNSTRMDIIVLHHTELKLNVIYDVKLHSKSGRPRIALLSHATH